MISPRVAVVVPVMNGERVLAGAVDSVLAQTLGDLELVLVDDGSTDRTPALFAAYAAADARVGVVTQENRGFAGARNAGIRASRAPVVAFLDSDDVWHPDKLERQVAVLDAHPEVEACYVHSTHIDAAGRTRADSPAISRRRVTALDLLEHGNLVSGSASSVVVRRDALEAIGLFDEVLAAAEDLDLWYRLALRADLRAVPEPLVGIRVPDCVDAALLARDLRGTLAFLAKVRRTGPLEHRAIARRRSRSLRWQLVGRKLRGR